MENQNEEVQKPKASPEDLVKDADAYFLQMLSGGRYRELITNMQNLGGYSLRNQLLIQKQDPKATLVNGMNSWNYQKRSIKPGEKSIRIIAPVTSSEVSTDIGGNVTEKQSEKVTGYKINFVFDISQTNAKENAKDEFRCDAGMLEDHYDIASEALKGSIKGYSFETSSDMNEGVTSVLDTDSKTITIADGLDKQSTLKTLINQIAAANVLRDRQNFSGLKPTQMANINTIEISAISNIVANRLGLTYEKLTEPDFSNMSNEDMDKFASNIGIVRSVSQKMILAVENKMSYELHMLEEAQSGNVESEGAAVPEITEAIPEKVETKKTTKAKSRTKPEAVMG